MNEIVTLLSDFGTEDHYVSAMKGRILTINPQVHCIDITHDVPGQDIATAAYLLSVAWKNFPDGTIHLCVVDPGVGSERKPMALHAQGHYFVGPDSGIFTYILRESAKWNARELSRADLFNSTVSNTFHGRDIFAPVAGHLSTGLPFELLGSVIENPVELEVSNIEIENGEIRGCIIHIDHFGNAITNITRAHLQMTHLDQDAIEMLYFDKKITDRFETYAEAGDEPFLLIGSNDYLECAVKKGSAEMKLGFQRGDAVTLRRRK